MEASKSSGVVVPRHISWRRRLAASVIALTMRLFMKTWRCQWIDASNGEVSGGPVIFCSWHNRLALAMASYDDFAKAQWPCAGMAAMVSASKDGGLLAAILEKFGIQPIRGSTSRRGRQALLEATTWIEKNYSVAITPDGPRGPVYKIQEGIILLAQVTGRPIIPISNHVRWKICFRSWDRFQIPLPFARCYLRFSEPIFVPREASEAEREQLRQKLEATMMTLTID